MSLISIKTYMKKAAAPTYVRKKKNASISLNINPPRVFNQ